MRKTAVLVVAGTCFFNNFILSSYENLTASIATSQRIMLAEPLRTITVMKSILLINTVQLFQQNYNNVEDEEFNLFLFSLLILGIIAICICVFIGIIITLLLLLIVFVLITVGALSGSLLVGLNKKSFTAGFKTFVILFSTASSAIIGGLSFWLLNKVLHWWTQEVAICTGIVSGLLGGFALGFFAAFIIQKVTTFFKAKLVKSKLD